MRRAEDLESLRVAATTITQSVSNGNLDAIRATLEYIHYSDADLRPETLRDHAPNDLSQTDAEDIVYRLNADGIITDEYIYTDTLDDVFALAEYILSQDAHPENELVATIPYDESALNQADYGPLLTSTLNLIRDADEQVVLMSPFLSEEAFKKLRPALRSTAQQGTHIILITRYLTYSDKDYNREFAKRILDDPKIKNSVTLYEYVDDDTWTTFHAKLLISDANAAYLGTANFTHKGFHGNLELGVVFNDATVQRLYNLADALLESEFLHPVGYSSGRFGRLTD